MSALIVSACLLGEACKWNGGSNRDERVIRLCAGRAVIPVCPEVAGGLPVPRIPCEIRGGAVVNRLGENVDEAFRAGAAACWARCAERENGQNEIVCAVLKARSPSCGSGEIYDGTFTGRLTAGDGVFAALVKARGIPVFTEEETEAANALMEAEENQ